MAAPRLLVLELLFMEYWCHLELGCLPKMTSPMRHEVFTKVIDPTNCPPPFLFVRKNAPRYGWCRKGMEKGKQSLKSETEHLQGETDTCHLLRRQ